MKFNSLWSNPFQFTPHHDDWSILDKLGGKYHGGVYLIRDSQDRKNLYVGKAENTSKDIRDRLNAHLSGKGNKNIAKRVINQETFTIRWIDSQNPALTESTLLIALNTLDELSTADNKRIEWQDKYSSDQICDEATRLGIYSEEAFVTNFLSWLSNSLKKIENQQSNKQPRQMLSVNSHRNSRMAGISIEDTEALLRQLQRFQEMIGCDWRSVISQWQNLQNCWQDPQYDRFEPFFEQLCHTYEQCEQQCVEYTQFLEERIRGSEDAAATLNV